MSAAESEEWIVSLHEAGHAVVAAVAGMEVQQVVLHAPGARHDEAGRIQLHDWRGERDADLARFLIFVMAGASAEKRAFGKTSARDGVDRKYALDLASICLELEPGSPRAAEMVRAAELIADARMHNATIWTWIEAVAKALVRRRRLTGRDVHELRPAEAR